MTDLLVLHGGTVRPGGGLPATTAIACADGRVVGLGPDAERLRTRAATVVDLAGDTVVPAFGDGHAHPVFAGLQRLGPALEGCTSVAELLERVRVWVAEHPGDGWVVGGRYDPTLAPRGEFDARWLDEVAPGRPVVLDASDHHTMWVSSEALRRAGITAATPEPAVGRIVRRDDGSPLGTLREWEACDLVRAHVPPWTAEQTVGAIAWSTATLAAAGVTWVQDAWVELDVLPAWLAAARADRLGCRVELAFRLDPARWREQLPLVRAAAAEVAALGHPRLTARSVKLFVDGVLEGGTATLLEPYLPLPGEPLPDPCAHAHPEGHGMPVWRATELHAAVAAAVAAGLRPHLHAIGDAAVRLGLDALEALDDPRGALRAVRPVLAHVQLVDPVDLPRFARLGVVANCEPLWAAWDDMQADLTAPRLGSERTARQYPLASLVRSGAPVSFGSDWPVTSHLPLEGVQVAVTRVPLERPDAAAWLPEQRLTVAEAVHAYTAGSAFQAFADDRGTLVPGAAADLVRLSADPFTVAPEEIGGIGVRQTWCEGQVTWRAP